MRFPLLRLGRWSNQPPQSLGRLEVRVLEDVWRHGELTVRQLHQSHADLAYTTLMTTLDRLHKKGLLRRCKRGRAFLYSPALSRLEFGKRLARAAVDMILRYAEPDTGAVLSYFVDTVGEADARLLQELESAVRARRRKEPSR